MKIKQMFQMKYVVLVVALLLAVQILVMKQQITRLEETVSELNTAASATELRLESVQESTLAKIQSFDSKFKSVDLSIASIEKLDPYLMELESTLTEATDKVDQLMSGHELLKTSVVQHDRLIEDIHKIVYRDA